MGFFFLQSQISSNHVRRLSCPVKIEAKKNRSDSSKILLHRSFMPRFFFRLLKSIDLWYWNASNYTRVFNVKSSRVLIRHCFYAWMDSNWYKLESNTISIFCSIKSQSQVQKGSKKFESKFRTIQIDRKMNSSLLNYSSSEVKCPLHLFYTWMIYTNLIVRWNYLMRYGQQKSAK